MIAALVFALALAVVADAQFPQSVFAPASPNAFGHSNIGLTGRKHQFDDRGQFTSSYSQTDGSSFQESGELHPTNDHKDNVIVKKGSYRYTSPEGIPVEVFYTADEYGFHPQGSHIPVSVQSQPPSFR